MNHPRRYQFHFQPCDVISPDEPEDRTDVILFFRDNKLRSHAVGHFVHTEEMKYWGKKSDVTPEMIFSSVDQLRELGCPFFTLNSSHLPPCQSSGYLCSLEQKCRVIVQPIENAYCAAMENIIRETGDLPRLSRFQGRSAAFYCWLFSDQSILIKMVWEKNCYNLMTAYKPRQGISEPFRETLNHVARKICLESNGEIVWCHPESWNRNGNGSTDTPLEKESHLTRKNRRSSYRQTKSRGGAKNFRDYLDANEE